MPLCTKIIFLMPHASLQPRKMRSPTYSIPYSNTYCNKRDGGATRPPPRTPVTHPYTYRELDDLPKWSHQYPGIPNKPAHTKDTAGRTLVIVPTHTRLVDPTSGHTYPKYRYAKAYTCTSTHAPTHIIPQQPTPHTLTAQHPPPIH